MTPELLPDGRLDIARTSWGDYLSRPAPTVSNEAAERLRRLVVEHPMYEGDLDEALRTERRMVVEQIRERLNAETEPSIDDGDDEHTVVCIGRSTYGPILDEIGGAR